MANSCYYPFDDGGSGHKAIEQYFSFNLLDVYFASNLSGI